MSDDGPDLSLLALLRASLGLGTPPPDLPPTTNVLSSASYIVDNSIDVAISASATKAAAHAIHAQMQIRKYSTDAWAKHELHPKPEGGEESLNLIFMVDLLNFSFWADGNGGTVGVTYGRERREGYWALLACLCRARDEGIPITDPHFWANENELTDEIFEHIFRCDLPSKMPMLSERLACLREAGRVLYEKYDCKFANVVAAAHGSAARLVNLLVDDFLCFRDEHMFHGRRVNLYKRAQILVADIWGCFSGESYGKFDDIDSITMFADYRVPQTLHAMGVLLYSPVLEGRIRRGELFDSGSQAEIEIRGCSIWAVEMMRREIVRQDPESGAVNSILIDFFLYDTWKERETEDEETKMMPHHRCRSIWY